jgi:ribosomal protein S18 acetylase RimI-like enzyme
MVGFVLKPYEKKYAQAVKHCALSAWKYTYQKIFTLTQIHEYIEQFYSPENEIAVDELISRELMHYSVALDPEDNLVGFQTSSIDMLHAELTRLYVLPEKIGAGIGSALLREAESFFLRSGFKSYQVKVHKYNIIGQRFYERNGFLFLGEDNADHLVLRKQLQSN